MISINLIFAWARIIGAVSFLEERKRKCLHILKKRCRINGMWILHPLKIPFFWAKYHPGTTFVLLQGGAPSLKIFSLNSKSGCRLLVFYCKIWYSSRSCFFMRKILLTDTATCVQYSLLYNIMLIIFSDDMLPAFCSRAYLSRSHFHIRKLCARHRQGYYHPKCISDCLLE